MDNCGNCKPPKKIKKMIPIDEKFEDIYKDRTLTKEEMESIALEVGTEGILLASEWEWTIRKTKEGLTLIPIRRNK